MSEADARALPHVRPAVPALISVAVLGVIALLPLLTGHSMRWTGLAEALTGAGCAVGCSAIALAASRRTRLPLHTAAGAVMAVSALNAVTPAGLGGTFVTLRLHRRTGLSVEDAAAAVAVRAIAGTYGALTGGALAAHWAGKQFHLHPPSPTMTAAVLVVLGALAVAGVARYSDQTVRAAVTTGRAVRAAVTHLRYPLRCVLLAVSMLGLLLAQVVTLHGALSAVGAAPSLSMLLVAQVGANAAKSASPMIPSGFGAVEAALVGALTAAGTSFGVATIGVVVYRAVGQWLPIAGGLVALARFRRLGLV